MGRAPKNRPLIVSPITSKKQLMQIADVCKFLGGISEDSLKGLRDDPDRRFPRPLQIISGLPMWTVEQLEKFVEREEKLAERIST